jgi:hypothetical protein
MGSAEFIKSRNTVALEANSVRLQTTRVHETDFKSSEVYAEPKAASSDTRMITTALHKLDFEENMRS